MSVARAAGRRLGGRTGVVAVAALLGALVGLGWGLGGEPEYTATTTAVIVDRGEAAERLGAGAVDAEGPASEARLLELARSEEVAELAAASLGGDVSGADLLARTDFRIGGGGGTLLIRSVASFPDFAAAAADAYRGAVIELAAAIERRRLRATSSRLEERIAELDPLAEPERVAELQDRLADVETLLAADDPLRPGREVRLPGEPSGERPTALLSGIGALAGAALAVLALLVGGRGGRPRAADEEAELAAALGAPVLAVLGRERAVRRLEPAIVALEPGGSRLEALAAAIGLEDEDAPRSLAICGTGVGTERAEIALGLAAAAAGAGIEAILLEADLDSPRLASRLGVPEAPGLAEYLVGDATPREVMRTIALDPDRASRRPDSFVLVGAGSASMGAEPSIAEPALEDLIARLGRVYELVIVVSPPTPGPAGSGPARSCEAAIVCALGGAVDPTALRTLRDELAGPDLLGGVLVAPGGGASTSA